MHAQNLISLCSILLVYFFVLQCFVTDRKVDEEIGTTQCFQADADDLLRQIMGFGKGQST